MSAHACTDACSYNTYNYILVITALYTRNCIHAGFAGLMHALIKSHVINFPRI